MPAYSGKYQHLSSRGAPCGQGACELSLDLEACTVTPAGGIPLSFDLGEVDATLDLGNGERIVLRQFGPAFGRMCEELLAAWRDRTVRCLLLEDLEEVERFNGSFNGSAAEIRIFGSNLAVLPLGGKAEQRRLADIDAVTFDEAAYAFHICGGGAELKIGKLAKRTEEFGSVLRGAVDGLRRRAAEVLHQTFPFLDAGGVRRLAALVPEGHSVKLTAWAGVHPDLPEALIAQAVDQPLRPYFDALRAKVRPESLMAGFKFVRQDVAAEESEAEGSAEAPAETRAPLFFWFFFPLAGRDVAAWEATTGHGRATYFFRTITPVEDSIARLTRGLALVNFRREPVYLPDASLDREARFHRYAIGRRKLPDMAELRAAFLGRAIHSSIEEWAQQYAELTRI